MATEDRTYSELAKALVEFQKNSPTIKKTKEAKVGSYSYTYADLADVVETIRKPLSACGLAFSQSPTNLNGEHALRTTVFHTSGEKISEVMRIPIGREVAAQQFGSALTYSKRYMLCAMLGLVTEDDNDAQDLATINGEQLYQLKRVAFKKGAKTAHDFQTMVYGLIGNTPSNILVSDFETVKKQLEGMEES